MHLCVLLLASGFIVVLVAHWPMDWFIRSLRSDSRIPAERPAEAVGVPPLIVGSFERLLAFFLVVLDVEGTYTLLAAWLAAKLAASWHRFPVKDDEAGRQVRAGTLSALITGVVSVSVGVLAGLAVCFACQ